MTTAKEVLLENDGVLLEAKGLSAWYGAAQILFDVSLDVRRGEVVALMGAMAPGNPRR